MKEPTSHHGHRRRAVLITSTIFAGYALLRLPKIQKVSPKPRDADQSPFLVDYAVRRILRGKARKRKYGKALKLRPVVDRAGRGDLKVKLGGHGVKFLHRVVALNICPVMTDRRGRERDPFFVTLPQCNQFEVHHGREGDTHDCRAGNLFVLYKEHHRRLKKHRRKSLQ